MQMDLLEPSGHLQASGAYLPERQAQMHEHHAEVLGEAVGQRVPAARLEVVQPDRWLVLVGLQLVGQEDLAVGAVGQLEELAAGPAEVGLDDRALRPCLVVRRRRRATDGATAAAAAARAAAAASVSLLLLAAARRADETLQARQLLYLHSADREFLA